MQSSGAIVGRLLPDCSVESVKYDLETLLVGNGLYPKEAEAMVKTWEDSWFEEGLRLFYILPRQQTDAIRPLEITPKPNKLVRVLMGRMEVMTPESEHEILGLLSRLKKAPETQNPAVSEVRKRYGRFLAPMILTVLDKRSDVWDPALESSLKSLDVPPRQRKQARPAINLY